MEYKQIKVSQSWKAYFFSIVFKSILLLLAIVASAMCFVFKDDILSINSSIPHNAHIYLSLIILCIAFLIAINIFWIYIVAKNTVYETADLHLKIHRGVLNKSIATIDFNKIKDLNLYKPFVGRLLGIATLQVSSKDQTLPVLFIDGIDVAVAEELFEYLNNQAVDNYVEYRRKKDQDIL
jgi:uncharacterized membrane protein YdbT with pleckstrin-like domain